MTNHLTPLITQSCHQLGSLLSRAVAAPDPEISGGPGLKKYFFWPQFGQKISEGQAPRAPPLDPPLKGVAQGGGNLNNYYCPMLGLSPVKGLFQKNPTIYIPSL